MLRPLTIVASFALLTICFGVTQSCKKASTASSIDSQPKFEERVKLWVFKVENVRLREAIRARAEFENVSFEGGDHDYYITLVAKGHNKESASRLLDRVSGFALDWGCQPDNQVWFHLDDGFDEQGNRKYKRIIENSVSLTSESH